MLKRKGNNKAYCSLLGNRKKANHHCFLGSRAIKL